MSSSDATLRRQPLRAVAADAGTEIFLVDAGFRRLASAVGELSAAVGPGLYKLRFRSGDTMTDQLVEVPPELPPGQGEILVIGEPLRFASALPLPDTRTTHEYHEAAWRHAGDPPDLALGAGSRLFVLVRDTDKRPGVQARHLPWRGLALCNADGRVLLDFEEAPRRDADLGFASANLELAPGTYVLRVATRLDGVIEMPVATCAGWQTQVALRSRTISRRVADPRGDAAAGRSRSARRADLADATVLMGRPGYRADPSNQQDRLTELARLGLVQGRTTLRPEDLRSMLWAKYENPMLGIYGAHLLLRGGERDMGLLHDVIGNLEAMLGQHADVAALRLALARHDGMAPPPGIRFDMPPMLARSWELIVEASIEQPELVPADSFAARVATKLVSGSHWLIWRRTSPLAAVRRQSGERSAGGAEEPVIANVLKSVQPAIARGLHSLSLAEPLERVQARLPSLARRVAKKLTPMQQAVLHELAATADLPAVERLGRLARTLRLPSAVLRSTLDELGEDHRIDLGKPMEPD